MPRYDFRTPRLYLGVPLHDGATVALDPSQANYLGNVLRLKPGDSALVFNGRDGEWQGVLASAGKRRLALTIGARTRPQGDALDLHYWFAPLKHARLDYMRADVADAQRVAIRRCAHDAANTDRT